MDFVFRVDGGRQIGYGHVYRCLVLADTLAKMGHESTFVTRSHDGQLAQTIRERGHDAVLVPVREVAGTNPASWLGDDPECDAAVTSEIATERRTSTVVADHYAVDLPWTRAVRRAGHRLVAIDDLADRELECDALVNQNLRAERLPYRALVGAETRLLLGATYALLAPEFAKARALRARALKSPRRGERLVVALGGSDPTNATNSVLESLAPLRSRSVRIDVVIGQGHPNPETVRAHASVFASGHVHVQAPPRMVAELLAHADVAIGAGGSSALERLCVGVPSIIVEVAANQRSTVEALAEAGLAIPYRLGTDPQDHLPDLVTRLLDDDGHRGDMQRRGQQLVDGQGAQRVATAVIGLIESETSS